MSKVDWIKEQEKLRIFQIKNLRKIQEKKEMYKLPIEVRLRKISKEDDFKIFLVDGFKVRKFVDYDFTMGGHGLRYIYVPINEIWIDNSNKKEKQEIIKHEITEFNLMKKGVDYNEAHDKASLKEIEIRHKTIILPVKHYRQINSWSCGPSSLKIVLDYYNNKKQIKELIKETKCSPAYPSEGTLHKGFIRAVKKYKYDFIEKQNASIEDIEDFIRKGIPVIVDYQAYHGGHFSVVIGYNERSLVLSDPAYDKKFKWISKKEFLKRWYEEDLPGKIVKKWLLAVY